MLVGPLLGSGDNRAKAGLGAGNRPLVEKIVHMPVMGASERLDPDALSNPVVAVMGEVGLYIDLEEGVRLQFEFVNLDFLGA